MRSPTFPRQPLAGRCGSHLAFGHREEQGSRTQWLAPCQNQNAAFRSPDGGPGQTLTWACGLARETRPREQIEMNLNHSTHLVKSLCYFRVRARFYCTHHVWLDERDLGRSRNRWRSFKAERFSAQASSLCARAAERHNRREGDGWWCRGAARHCSWWTALFVVVGGVVG